MATDRSQPPNPHSGRPLRGRAPLYAPLPPHPDDAEESQVVCTAIAPAEDSQIELRLRRFQPLTQPLPLAPAPADPAALRAVLTAEMANFAPAIERVAGALWLARHVGRRRFHLPPLLLAGPPGVGKSRFARRIGEVADIPTYFFDAGGSADNRSFMGAARAYTTAQVGFPVLCIANAGVANPIIMVDEIDKTVMESSNGSIVATLLNLLDPQTACRHWDEMLQGPVDLSAITWIFACNEPGRLPGTFLSRVDVVEVERPSEDAFPVLLAAACADIAQAFGVGPDRLPALDDLALERLRRDFRRHRSPRALVQALRGILAARAERTSAPRSPPATPSA